MWIIENVHVKYPISLDNRTGGFGSPETASEIQAQGFGWMVGNPYLITNSRLLIRATSPPP